MSGRGLGSALLAAWLVLAPAAAAAQGGVRATVASVVQTVLGQLRVVATDRTPVPDRPPATLRACGELYDRPILNVAQGPELAASYDDWIIASFRVITDDNAGLPLPVCFRWGGDAVDTNLGRYLLEVNAQYIRKRYSRAPGSDAERRFFNGYLLTGHVDPAETDTALATRRAEAVRARLPGVPCRYLVRPAPREQGAVYHRKVFFSYQPVLPSCPRPPS